jgi:hypothetical protein
MATVMHHGPYDKIDGAYEAIMEWMIKNGYKPAEPCREVYLVRSPKNPSDYKTKDLLAGQEEIDFISPPPVGLDELAQVIWAAFLACVMDSRWIRQFRRDAKR